MCKIIEKVEGRELAHIVKYRDGIYYVDTARVYDRGDFKYETMVFPAHEFPNGDINGKYNVSSWEELFQDVYLTFEDIRHDAIIDDFEKFFCGDEFTELDWYFDKYYPDEFDKLDEPTAEKAVFTEKPYDSSILEEVSKKSCKRISERKSDEELVEYIIKEKQKSYSEGIRDAQKMMLDWFIKKFTDANNILIARTDPGSVSSRINLKPDDIFTEGLFAKSTDPIMGKED